MKQNIDQIVEQAVKEYSLVVVAPHNMEGVPIDADAFAFAAVIYHRFAAQAKATGRELVFVDDPTDSSGSGPLSLCLLPVSNNQVGFSDDDKVLISAVRVQGKRLLIVGDTQFYNHREFLRNGEYGFDTIIVVDHHNWVVADHSQFTDGKFICITGHNVFGNVPNIDSYAAGALTADLFRANPDDWYTFAKRLSIAGDKYQDFFPKLFEGIPVDKYSALTRWLYLLGTYVFSWKPQGELQFLRELMRLRRRVIRDVITAIADSSDIEELRMEAPQQAQTLLGGGFDQWLADIEGEVNASIKAFLGSDQRFYCYEVKYPTDIAGLVHKEAFGILNKNKQLGERVLIHWQVVQAKRPYLIILMARSSDYNVLDLSYPTSHGPNGPWGGGHKDRAGIGAGGRVPLDMPWLESDPQKALRFVIDNLQEQLRRHDAEVFDGGKKKITGPRLGSSASAFELDAEIAKEAKPVCVGPEVARDNVDVLIEQLRKGPTANKRIAACSQLEALTRKRSMEAAVSPLIRAALKDRNRYAREAALKTLTAFYGRIFSRTPVARDKFNKSSFNENELLLLLFILPVMRRDPKLAGKIYVLVDAVIKARTVMEFPNLNDLRERCRLASIIPAQYLNDFLKEFQERVALPLGEAEEAKEEAKEKPAAPVLQPKQARKAREVGVELAEETQRLRQLYDAVCRAWAAEETRELVEKYSFDRLARLSLAEERALLEFLQIRYLFQEIQTKKRKRFFQLLPQTDQELYEILKNLFTGDISGSLNKTLKRISKGENFDEVKDSAIIREIILNRREEEPEFSVISRSGDGKKVLDDLTKEILFAAEVDLSRKRSEKFLGELRAINQEELELPALRRAPAIVSSLQEEEKIEKEFQRRMSQQVKRLANDRSRSAALAELKKMRYLRTGLFDRLAEDMSLAEGTRQLLIPEKGSVNFFYFGGNEIGCPGILLEITGENRTVRILLDVGQKMQDEKRLYDIVYMRPRTSPDIGIKDFLDSGCLAPLKIYREDLSSTYVQELLKDKSGVDAILVTHAHVDHAGNLALVHPEVPVYVGPETWAALLTIDHSGSDLRKEYFEWEDRKTGALLRRKFRVFEYEKPFAVDGIECFAMQVDHSAVGACGFFLNSPIGWLAWTGNLRKNFEVDKSGAFISYRGRTESFIRKAKELKVAALFMEGTNFDRSEASFETESGIRDRSASEVLVYAQGKPVIASFNYLNIIRLEMMIEAARQTRRKLVVSTKQIYLLESLKEGMFRDYLKKGGFGDLAELLFESGALIKSIDFKLSQDIRRALRECLLRAIFAQAPPRFTGYLLKEFSRNIRAQGGELVALGGKNQMRLGNKEFLEEFFNDDLDALELIIERRLRREAKRQKRQLSETEKREFTVQIRGLVETQVQEREEFLDWLAGFDAQDRKAMANMAWSQYPESGGKLSEDVRQSAGKEFERSGSLIERSLEICSGLDIEKFAGYCREFDIRTYGIPDVTVSDDLLVYLPRKMTGAYSLSRDYRKFEQTLFADSRIRGRLVRKSEVASGKFRISDLIIVLNSQDISELLGLVSRDSEVYFIYSQSHPLDLEMEIDYDKLVKWLNRYNIRGERLKLYVFHASGHLFAEQLVEMALDIKPRNIILVHAEGRKQLARELGRRFLKAGEQKNLPATIVPLHGTGIRLIGDNQATELPGEWTDELADGYKLLLSRIPPSQYSQIFGDLGRFKTNEELAQELRRLVRSRKENARIFTYVERADSNHPGDIADKIEELRNYFMVQILRAAFQRQAGVAEPADIAKAELVALEEVLAGVVEELSFRQLLEGITRMVFDNGKGVPNLIQARHQARLFISKFIENKKLGVVLLKSEKDPLRLMLVFKEGVPLQQAWFASRIMYDNLSRFFSGIDESFIPPVLYGGSVEAAVKVYREGKILDENEILDCSFCEIIALGDSRVTEYFRKLAESRGRLYRGDPSLGMVDAFVGNAGNSALLSSITEKIKQHKKLSRQTEEEIARLIIEDIYRSIGGKHLSELDREKARRQEAAAYWRKKPRSDLREKLGELKTGKIPPEEISVVVAAGLQTLDDPVCEEFEKLLGAGCSIVFVSGQDTSLALEARLKLMYYLEAMYPLGIPEYIRLNILVRGPEFPPVKRVYEIALDADSGFAGQLSEIRSRLKPATGSRRAAKNRNSEQRKLVAQLLSEYHLSSKLASKFSLSELQQKIAGLICHGAEVTAAGLKMSPEELTLTYTAKLEELFAQPDPSVEELRTMLSINPVLFFGRASRNSASSGQAQRALPQEKGNIIFWRDPGKISGGIVEIRVGETKLYFDLGAEGREEYFTNWKDFSVVETIPSGVEAGFLPLIPEILRDDMYKADFVAELQGLKIVFVSHAHEDHIQALFALDKDIVIVTSGITKAALEGFEWNSAGRLRSEYTVIKQRYTMDRQFGKSYPKSKRLIFTLADNLPLNVGDARVTSIPVGHSIPGSVAFRIATACGVILYTGDYALSYDARLTREFMRKAGEDELLMVLTEGSSIRPRPSDSANLRKVKREEDYFDQVDRIVKDTGHKLMITSFKWNNFTRLELFYRLSKDNRRKLVVSPEIMYFVKKLSDLGIAGARSIFYDDDVLVHVPQRQWGNDKAAFLKTAFGSYDQPDCPDASKIYGELADSRLISSEQLSKENGQRDTILVLFAGSLERAGHDQASAGFGIFLFAGTGLYQGTGKAGQ